MSEKMTNEDIISLIERKALSNNDYVNEDISNLTTNMNEIISEVQKTKKDVRLFNDQMMRSLCSGRWLFSRPELV